MKLTRSKTVKSQYNVKRLIIYLKSSESVLWYRRSVHGFRKHWWVVISIDDQYFNCCGAIHRWNAFVFGLKHDEQRVMMLVSRSCFFYVVFRVILRLIRAHVTYRVFCSLTYLLNRYEIQAMFRHYSFNLRNKSDS